ncbi:hypothetical protein AMIS_75090 [Actinoplanes missouriensis 431]|uniref:Uncharacterized protein n=1 Tax=Actinoplanes missouriensis (strain ATCC 14538 / DSM 43046 / CBS 188.64 / JCM 3121 / NBRC 102363 / NCIMB 12654 / NRRL B-3342 / UNCC 431) TaxID=512565 RepID=I0HI92_ACTM4|nr:hypothetical protein [Actinoplanes missouriensis]BAL92729.1 hypothetical protein AMIS_75090 [Actinoplanes missouriensis 431]
MTAEPAGQVMWSPGPVRQRRRDFTIEDVLKFPDDAPRVELDDGVLIEVPDPSLDHDDIADQVWWWLRQNAPEEFRPGTEAGVAAGYADDLVSGACELVADADEELVLSAPFEIRLPIRDITP